MGVFGGLVLDGLLSRQEEHELGRIVQAGLEAERSLDEASAQPSSLSTDAADTNPTEVLQVTYKTLQSPQCSLWLRVSCVSGTISAAHQDDPCQPTC